MTCSRLATTLDEVRLAAAPVMPVPFDTDDADLPKWTGREVSEHLGGRLLLRYLTPVQVGTMTGGTSDVQYVTPTPYAPDEAISWLALPAPTVPRQHALVLKPEVVDVILGPRVVRWGGGIEYLLPNGFPRTALHFAWEIRIS